MRARFENAKPPPPPGSLPPYEVGATELPGMKTDPVIGSLINDTDEYNWARPGKAGSAYQKGYERFHTPDGRPCISAGEGLWLLVKRAADRTK